MKEAASREQIRQAAEIMNNSERSTITVG